MPHAQVVSFKYILVCEEADIAEDVGEDLWTRVMCMTKWTSSEATCRRECKGHVEHIEGHQDALYRFLCQSRAACERRATHKKYSRPMRGKLAFKQEVR